MDGDSIYNGADDNGSGTVASSRWPGPWPSQLDEAAPALGAFVHVSGEEKGLLGSSGSWTTPRVDRWRAIANINADMVGGDAHRDTLVVIGKTYSTWGPWWTR
jgi:Zn-dependent M28 family amino/carboxypeptidase